MKTYADLLLGLASGPSLVCQRFITPTGVLERTAADVLSQAHRRGAQLIGCGLKKGQRVGLVVTDAADFLPLIHACLLYGLVAVPMFPPPLFGSLQAYTQALSQVLAVAQTDLLVIDDHLATKLGALAVSQVITTKQLTRGPAARPAKVEPTDLALLQFTSGSTSTPKGVCISHAALMANAHAIMVDGLGAGPADHGVTWLPLYHDMGLIGFGLAPLLTRTPVTFLPTARFIRNPALWLQTIAEQRATITFAPNFAYALVTRRVDGRSLDLSSVRMWGCGAEPISAATLDAFEQHFAVSGVKPGQVSPCYGLAEATLAVAFTPPSSGRVSHILDAESWHESGSADSPSNERTIAIVSCGVPLPGYRVRIVDDAGKTLGEHQAGEVIVQGPSLGDGYFCDAQQSGAAFRQDGLHTGDRGYLADGHLFVTGRIKDCVIVQGRNYDPHTIEQAAENTPMVRRAVAINYQAAHGEELAVLVERTGRDDAALIEQVRVSIAAATGLQATQIVCLPPGGLPRTTSGKLRRAEARALLKTNRIPVNR